MFFFKTQSLVSAFTTYITGMNRMMPIAVMLLLAWAMSTCLVQLGADRFVAQVLAAQFDQILLPPFIFIVACLISFATGSSWGTFALIFPLALPAAVAMDASLALSVAAVLSGGLFGDHASPISETTILASAGADIDTLEHFRTQLPYALMNGTLCLAGLLLASATSLVWSLPILLAAQLTCLVLIKQLLKPS
jgi:Na+/H+ antiporter NhaC